MTFFGGYIHMCAICGITECQQCGAQGADGEIECSRLCTATDWDRQDCDGCKLRPANDDEAPGIGDS